LHPSWLQALQDEFSQPYMQQLRDFLRQEKQQHTIYPPGPLIFNALNSTPLDNVKAVIIGQDPYHGPGQAHGLCFSVPRGVPIPPSLRNIYKELHDDLGIAPANHGNLQSWAEQGVLLLNAVLTVRQGQAGSHQGRGWETFTDRVIEHVNSHCQNVVFFLWGSYAQKKGQCIDSQRHCILRAPHPSPLSAHRGFFGSRPFSQANHWLQQHRLAPIDWQIPA
jgi:uracil-DNA glycosylase